MPVLAEGRSPLPPPTVVSSHPGHPDPPVLPSLNLVPTFHPGTFLAPFAFFLAGNTNPVSGETCTTYKTSDRTLEEPERAVGKEETQGIQESKRKVVTTCGNGMIVAVLWLT